MSLVITNEFIRQTSLNEKELKSEIAVMLYQKRKFTLGQASRFLETTQLGFQKILAKLKIPLNYDKKELAYDVETLKKNKTVK